MGLGKDLQERPQGRPMKYKSKFADFMDAMPDSLFAVLGIGSFLFGMVLCLIELVRWVIKMIL